MATEMSDAGAAWATPEQSEPGQYVLSDWGPRAGAWMIDAVIVGGVGLLIQALLLSGEARVAQYAASTALSLAYFVPLMVSTNGRTLGKMATGLRVIRTDLRPVNITLPVWRECLLKGLIAGVLIDALTLASGVGVVAGFLVVALDYLWPLWDRERRAVHDMLARTRVTRHEPVFHLSSQ